MTTHIPRRGILPSRGAISPSRAAAAALPDVLLVEADRLRDQARTDPTGVLGRTAELLAAAGKHTELRVVARHAACLAHVELGELTAALRHARLAFAAAQRAGLTQRAARLRLTLAWIDIDRGRSAASVIHLDAAQPVLLGAEQAIARCLRGLGMCARGDYAQAVTELTAAVLGLRAEADHPWRANALIGRGIARIHLRRLRCADADFAEAQTLLSDLGAGERAAACVHNRGFVALYAGDLAGALALFDEALASGLDTAARPEAIVDRAEALRAAGLGADARQALDHAVKVLAAAGRGAMLADAMLTLACCAEEGDDSAAAIVAAARAARLFRRQGRSAWASLAAAVEVRARLSAGEGSAALLSRAQRTAAACVEHGWLVPAAELRTCAARAAISLGQLDSARALLEPITPRERGRPLRVRAGSARLRAVERLAQALRAEIDGDGRALRACRAGLDLLERNALALNGSQPWLPVRALAAQLEATGLKAVLAAGRARAVLRWTQRCHPGMRNLPSVRPPADAALADALVALRAAHARAMRGQPNGAVQRQVVELERWIRERPVVVEPGRRDDPALPIPQVCRQLNGAMLVSVFVHDGFLGAVSVVDHSVRLHRLAPVSAVTAEVDALRFALHGQARGTRGAMRGALRRSAELAASALDGMLVRRIGRWIGDRELVIVPAGPLHALPWAVLPSCRGRPVTVAPSVRSWLRAAGPAGAADAGDRDDTTVWVAGPGLRHAEREVRALHEAGGGHMLVGGNASVDGVLEALAGARTVHIAAHGRFRAEAPLFSHLELADGPLYGYDLDRLPSAPRLVVLSACEAGLSTALAGTEMTGLATVLLRKGTATLVASVLPVPDERTPALMTSLHAGLRSGLRPAAALAAAQAEHGHLGFICIGAG